MGTRFWEWASENASVFGVLVLRLASRSLTGTRSKVCVCVRGIGIQLAYGIEPFDMSANMEKFIFASSARISDAFDMVEFSRYVLRPYTIAITR